MSQQFSTTYKGYVIRYNKPLNEWEVFSGGEIGKPEDKIYSADSLAEAEQKIDQKVKRDAKKPFKRIPIFRSSGLEGMELGEVSSLVDQDIFFVVWDRAEGRKSEKQSRRYYGYSIYLDNEKNKAGKERLLEIKQELKVLQREAQTIRAGLELFEPNYFCIKDED